MNRWNRLKEAFLLLMVVCGASRLRVLASEVTEWQQFFQNRAETLVREISGTSSAWVFAKLETELDGRDRKFHPAGAGQELLPGISADDIAPQIRRHGTEERPFRIKAVELYVLVPSWVSARRAGLLKDRLPTLLGLDLKGRDKLVIETIPVSGVWARVWQHLKETLPLLLVSGQVLMLLAGVFLLMGPVRWLIEDFKRRQVEREAPAGAARVGAAVPFPSSWGPEARGAASAGLTDSNGRTGANGSKPEGESLVSFISEKNLDTVAHLLSYEPPDLVSYIISHVPPALGASILDSLPPEKRQATVRELASLKVHEPEKVRAMARRLSERLDCVSGGPELLGEIFWEMNSEAQEAYLKILEKTDPGIAQEVRRKLISIDDVFALEPTSLRQVLWEAYRSGTDLVAVLGSRSKEEQTKALACLPSSLQRVLESDLSLNSSAADDGDRRVESEKRLLLAARRLLLRPSKSKQKIEV